MLKIRNFWVSWRRYRFVMLLLGVCSIAILVSPQTTLSTQSIPTVTTELTGVQVAKQPLALPGKSPTLPTEKPSILTANVKKTVLANGLTVLTKEVRNAPVVTVQVWYNIGSRHEAPGVNGIAHLLEHMLFKGTKERPIRFGRLFAALGSSSNAITSYDKTFYFGTVEKNKLSSLLVLEADRMQNATIDAEQLNSEKRVVISELQGKENSPIFRLYRAVKQAAFPNSPYGLTVIGTKADVEKFTVEQVQSYYDSYYGPNNATLVVVGDFDTPKLMAKVDATFGKVPRREIDVTKSTPTNIKPTRRLTLKEPGSTKLSYRVYPLPDINHPDVPALDVMDYVLAHGRSSRMYQSIVETGMATSLGGSANNRAAGGWYEISSAVEVGKSLPKVEAAIEKEIELLQTKGATASEIARAKAQLKATHLLNNRDIVSQAQRLGEEQTITGDYRFIDKYLAGVERVTLADVRRVAKKYLQPNLKTIGFFEPTQITDKAAPAATGGQTAGITTTDAHAATSGKTAGITTGAPLDPSELAKYLPPLDAETNSQTQSLPQEVKLKNGLRVFLLPDASTPTVTLSGSIQAGTEYDTPKKAGLAGLTAANIMNGTKTQTAMEITKTLENRGAGLAFGAGREGVGLGGSALSSDLPILLQTLADVVQNANFPHQKFELSRQQALTGVKLELDHPKSVARRKLQQMIYPQDHPFTIFPTAETLSALTTADLQTFYRQHYLPSNTMLAIVGDFKVAEVKGLLAATLGKWSTTAAPVLLKYPPQLPTQQVMLSSSLPGKTQSITVLGHKAIDRQDPRYYSALVLNQILGENAMSSRLGNEIRDRQGLTYHISSNFNAGKRQGTFIISMQTAPENAQKATQSTISLLKDLQTKGVTAAEVASAKGSITSNYTVGLAFPDEIAKNTLSNAIYGLNPNEISEFPKKIQAVTLEQVNQVAKELIQPDRLVVVTAGPPQK